jgi:hypothetical protein
VATTASREEDDAGVVGQLDPCHSARRPALRADAARGEAQQLRIAGDEHELVVIRALRRADDLVFRFASDEFEVRLVGPVAGGDAFDDALPRAERN